MMRRILIADANLKVRTALRLVVEHDSSTQAAAEAKDATELFRILSGRCADIALVDVELPQAGETGELERCSFAELVAAIYRLCPAMKVIALSSQPTDENMSLSAGADGFICKSDPPDALLALLDQVDVTPPER